MADISKITLPSGSTYDIKDAVARAAIAAINNWEYLLCTNAANTPQGVTWQSGSTTITGTLVASANTQYKIYLVPRELSETRDVFEEYITIHTTGTTYVWEKMGTTDIDIGNLGAFAYADTGTVTITPRGNNDSSAVTFTGGTSKSVLGASTTFSGANSSVTFGEHTKSTVLTSDVTATVPHTQGTSKYLTATASNTQLNAPTGSALTALGTPTTETFVKSYPGQTSKLSTTTIIGVDSSTTTASKASAGTAVAVAKIGTAVQAVTSFTTPDQGTVGDLLATATVDSEILTIGAVKASKTSITPAVSNGTITPYTFSDVTVPIKKSSPTTVATGSVAANAGGASVLVGLGTPTTDTAVQSYSPSSDNFITGVSVSQEPKITLNSASSTSTGAVTYVSSVGTSGTDNVTFDTTTAGKTAQAITALGTATAAGQTVTAGTNDRVTAITGIGTGTAAGQTFHGTTETYTVNPVTT